MHSRNAALSICSTPSGIMMPFKLLQPWNVASSIRVNPSGSTISLKLKHWLNASLRIWSTFFGIKTLTRLEQKEKAPYDISVKLDESITLSRLSQWANRFIETWVIPSESSMFFNFPHPSNALPPMKATDLGSSILTSSGQFANAPYSMRVMLSGITISLRLEQL